MDTVKHSKSSNLYLLLIDFEISRVFLTSVMSWQALLKLVPMWAFPVRSLPAETGLCRKLDAVAWGVPGIAWGVDDVMRGAVAVSDRGELVIFWRDSRNLSLSRAILRVSLSPSRCLRFRVVCLISDISQFWRWDRGLVLWSCKCYLIIYLFFNWFTLYYSCRRGWRGGGCPTTRSHYYVTFFGCSCVFVCIHVAKK